MNTPACSPSRQWLTEKELADLLKISTRHLINLRKAGLPYFRLGAVVRYDLVEVIGYLKTHRLLCSHFERQQRRAASEQPRT
jgi:phage terminase Nu1 subunit (DNA packaging protein)